MSVLKLGSNCGSFGRNPTYALMEVRGLSLHCEGIGSIAAG